MLQNLKLKLVAINVVSLTVVLVAVFVSVYFLLEAQLKRQEKTLLNKVVYDESVSVQSYAGDAETTDVTGNTENYVNFTIENEGNPLSSSSMRMFYVKLDSSGAIISISSYNILQKREDIVYLLNKVNGIGKKDGEVDLGLVDTIKLSFLVADRRGDRIYVFIDRSNREETMSAYVYTAGIALLGSVICVFFISIYTAGRSIKPVKESMERQDKFVADASHELRTPIAVIRSNTELIMDSPEQTIGENMKWLEYIYKEAKRMTKMTEDLLLLSHADAKKEVSKEDVNLSALTAEVYDSFKPLLAGNNLSANGADIVQDVHILANELGIRQLLTILMDNAIKYTKEGGISVKLEEDAESAYIKVIDTGMGMPKEMKEKIFERFFRIDKARSKATGGFGLGLSIAKAIADEHGGVITVESAVGKGSEFCVKLPLLR